MSDISTKLTYLNTTKGKIKDVINMTGANITSDTTFRNYATKLYDGYISVLKDKNTLLDNMPKGTSTGAITDAADLPVYEDKMSKESTQDGTPTPDNPIEVKTVKGYRNLFDKDNVDWYKNNNSSYDSVIDSNSTRISTTGFSLQGGKTYILSGIPENINFLAIRTYNIPSGQSTDEATRNGMIFSIPENINYVRLLFSGSNFTDETNELMKNANIQIVEGTEELPYVPYGTNYVYTAVSNGTDTNYYTIPLNDNEIVGKGINLDELIIDKHGHCFINKKFAKIDSYDGETITTDYWSTIGGLDTGATIYYVLATPELIDLNYTVDLTLFEGVNNISNSEDMDMEIKYIKDTYE